MKKLSKIVVTIVAVIVFLIISFVIIEVSGGRGSSLILLALLWGLIAAIKAVWKKETPKYRNNKPKDIDVSDNDNENTK